MTERITTDALGFPLTVEIVIGDILPRGRHKTYEDEAGRGPDDAIHILELRAGLTGAELAEVIAHEAYHLFYCVRDLIAVGEETEAEVFGHFVKRMHSIYGEEA